MGKAAVLVSNEMKKAVTYPRLSRAIDWFNMFSQKYKTQLRWFGLLGIAGIGAWLYTKYGKHITSSLPHMPSSAAWQKAIPQKPK